MSDPDNKQAIPDFTGAEKGLMGVKTPVGVNQEDEIRDRLRAGGVERTLKMDHDAAATPQAETPVAPATEKPKFPSRADGYEGYIVRGLHRNNSI